MLSEHVSLRDLNTLRLSASATALRSPDTIDGLRTTLDEARRNNLPLIVLGEGSNVVLAGDLDALVLRYRGMGRQVLRVDEEQVTLRIGAGENWHAVTIWTLEQGYYGLENLALIPGSVGAAPVQNIGAYGVELSQFVDRVGIVHLDSGELEMLSSADCEFGYRDSVFKGRLRDRCLITSVDLTLRRRDTPEASYTALAAYLDDRERSITAQAVFDAVVALRRARLPDPHVTPNAGSFFKNPVVTQERAQLLLRQYPLLPVFALGDARAKLPAGWLIEACGWKGYSANGVGVHAAHALVVVNQGADTGTAVLELAARIQASVRLRFGCELEIEPRIYGVAA